MEAYDRHIFVCTGKRCAKCGSEDIIDLVKEEVALSGLKGRVRISRSGCVKVCKETEREGELSPVAIVYPEGVWYRNFSRSEVRDVVEGHLKGGRPVERILHFSLEEGGEGKAK